MMYTGENTFGEAQLLRGVDLAPLLSDVSDCDWAEARRLA